MPGSSHQETIEQVILGYIQAAPRTAQQILEYLISLKVELIIENPRMLYALLRRLHQKMLVNREWQTEGFIPLRLYELTAYGHTYLDLSPDERQAFSEVSFERIWLDRVSIG